MQGVEAGVAPMKHAFAFCSLACATLSLAACTTNSAQPEPAAPVPTSTPSPASNGGNAATGVAGASAAGVANGGGQEKMCGGIAGLRCPDKQYCSYAPEAQCGAADMSGTCAPIPEVCTEQLDEVCGCDDKTYGNACAAARAGVSVAMKGACKPGGTVTPPAGTGAAEGSLCGTRGAPQECAPGLYCAYKTQCGATDAGGTCSKRPTMCTKIYAPVCGCDGKTYASACTAASAGISVAKTGECAKSKASP
jgi:hypothetical protein